MRDDMKNEESTTKEDEEEESESSVITFFSQLLSSFCLFDHMSGEEPKVLVYLFIILCELILYYHHKFKKSIPYFLF